MNKRGDKINGIIPSVQQRKGKGINGSMDGSEQQHAVMKPNTKLKHAVFPLLSPQVLNLPLL